MLRVWRLQFILAGLEATAAVAVLFSIPREGAGFSVGRAAILAMLVAVLLLATLWAVRPPLFLVRSAGLAAIVASGTLAALVGVCLFLLRYLKPDVLLPFYQRLGVPLWLVLALSVQIFGILLVQRFGIHPDGPAAFSTWWRRAGIALTVLLAALAIVSRTRLGLMPDAAYWGEPGVPILGWQLALAVLAGLGVLLLALRWSGQKRLDLAIGMGIWLLAVVAWLSVPLEVLQNSFYAPIRPPSGQPFPNSDAGYYDSMAQSILIGHAYQGEIPSRPLYVVGLAALHALLGERYDLIIAGQTLILALIPVLLFGLGRALHSRPAGAIAALAAIGREYTSLLVSSATRVSNTKMLLTDLPTLFAMLACCVLCLHWLAEKKARWAALAGGMFGLLLLLRVQALLVLPGVIGLALLTFGPRTRRSAIAQVGLFLAAAALAILPWLVHNYRITGGVSLDAPFQLRIIASQYRYTGNLDIANVDLEGKSILAVLSAFAARDPGFVLGFIANHALATQVGAMLALPLFHDYRGLLADVYPYWANWAGWLSLPNMILTVGYLVLIAIGLASAWDRHRWAGLMPLSFSFGYSLANGVARFSGWRYDLPADWIAYFYLSIGVAELLLVVVGLLGGRRDLLQSARHPAASSPEGWRPLIAILAFFVLAGAMPWLAELASAPRYADTTEVELAEQLEVDPAVRALGIDRATIRGALESPGTVLQVGRVLYPRFFSRGTGLASAHPWPAYAPREFPRLGFLLLNETRHDVLLPVRKVPLDLPHGADAILLGCQAADYIEARIVLIPSAQVAVKGAPVSEPCP